MRFMAWAVMISVWVAYFTVAANAQQLPDPGKVPPPYRRMPLRVLSDGMAQPNAGRGLSMALDGNGATYAEYFGNGRVIFTIGINPGDLLTGNSSIALADRIELRWHPLNGIRSYKLDVNAADGEWREISSGYPKMGTEGFSFPTRKLRQIRLTVWFDPGALKMFRLTNLDLYGRYWVDRDGDGCEDFSCDPDGDDPKVTCADRPCTCDCCIHISGCSCNPDNGDKCWLDPNNDCECDCCPYEMPEDVGNDPAGTKNRVTGAWSSYSSHIRMTWLHGYEASDVERPYPLISEMFSAICERVLQSHTGVAPYLGAYYKEYLIGNGGLGDMSAAVGYKLAAPSGDFNAQVKYAYKIHSFDVRGFANVTAEPKLMIKPDGFIAVNQAVLGEGASSGSHDLTILGPNRISNPERRVNIRLIDTSTGMRTNEGNISYFNYIEDKVKGGAIIGSVSHQELYDAAVNGTLVEVDLDEHVVRSMRLLDNRTMLLSLEDMPSGLANIPLLPHTRGNTGTQLRATIMLDFVKGKIRPIGWDRDGPTGPRVEPKEPDDGEKDPENGPRDPTKPPGEGDDDDPDNPKDPNDTHDPDDPDGPGYPTHDPNNPEAGKIENPWDWLRNAKYPSDDVRIRYILPLSMIPFVDWSDIGGEVGIMEELGKFDGFEEFMRFWQMALKFLYCVIFFESTYKMITSPTK